MRSIFENISVTRLNNTLIQRAAEESFGSEGYRRHFGAARLNFNPLAGLRSLAWFERGRLILGRPLLVPHRASSFAIIRSIARRA